MLKSLNEKENNERKEEAKKKSVCKLKQVHSKVFLTEY